MPPARDPQKPPARDRQMSTSADQQQAKNVIDPFIDNHQNSPMPVRVRANVEGPALVFVTTTVVDWLPIFRSPVPALIALDQLAQAITHFGLSCVAYVLMTHHLHLVVGMPEYRMLSKFMQSYKVLSSKRIRELSLSELAHRERRKSRFQLWKPRFDDLVIESEEQFAIKMRYIHDNPVRAGVVRNAEDWPYSSAAFWLNGGPSLIPIDSSFRWQRYNFRE